MVDIKLAVKKAKEYLAEFFPEKADSIRLEETELDEGGNLWKITLSFLEEKDREKRPRSPFSDRFESSIVRDYRIYKSLKVRAKDGEILGMKIWKEQ
jgi:hypothetical protein